MRSPSLEKYSPAFLRNLCMLSPLHFVSSVKLLRFIVHFIVTECYFVKIDQLFLIILMYRLLIMNYYCRLSDWGLLYLCPFDYVQFLITTSALYLSNQIGFYFYGAFNNVHRHKAAAHKRQKSSDVNCLNMPDERACGDGGEEQLPERTRGENLERNQT